MKSLDASYRGLDGLDIGESSVGALYSVAESQGLKADAG